MKGFKTALIVGLACCVAATSGLAREISSHSKSARSEKSSRSSNGKKRSSASAKSRKGKSAKESRGKRSSEEQRYFAGLSELPPEELPEPESETVAETEVR